MLENAARKGERNEWSGGRKGEGGSGKENEEEEEGWPRMSVSN